MNGKLIVGALLIVLGLFALFSPTFSFTHKEKVVDMGPVEVNRDKRETFSFPSALGVVSLVAGVAVLAMGVRR